MGRPKNILSGWKEHSGQQLNPDEGHEDSGQHVLEHTKEKYEESPRQEEVIRHHRSTEE
jgi:hypothetical protein